MHLTLKSYLPKETVIERLQALLRSEHINFHVDGNNIITTDIPLPIFSFDKRLYSRNNWLGINPFVVVSRIDFAIQGTANIQIDITIDRLRSFVIYLLIISLACLIVTSIPNLYFGICFFLFFIIISWLILFKLCIYLIVNEINKSLS